MAHHQHKSGKTLSERGVEDVCVWYVYVLCCVMCSRTLKLCMMAPGPPSLLPRDPRGQLRRGDLLFLFIWAVIVLLVLLMYGKCRLTGLDTPGSGHVHNISFLMNTTHLLSLILLLLSPSFLTCFFFADALACSILPRSIQILVFQVQTYMSVRCCIGACVHAR